MIVYPINDERTFHYYYSMFPVHLYYGTRLPKMDNPRIQSFQ